MAVTDIPNQSLVELIAELRSELRKLTQQEVELAKTEIKEKASLTVKQISLVVGGAILALFALNYLLLTLMFALGIGFGALEPRGFAYWFAPFLIAVVTGIAAYVTIKKGLTTLQRSKLMPEKTIRTLKENSQWLNTQRPTPT